MTANLHSRIFPHLFLFNVKVQGLRSNALGFRFNSFFKYLAKQSEHKNNYKYEITNNPKEWEYVEQLLPFKTVPNPSLKVAYPSGWKPMQEASLCLPYFVERSKNHMLSVYLKIHDRGQLKVTLITKVHGNLWQLHDEVKSYMEEKVGKKIPSFVHEGNNAVYFKGDYVYYAEQWLLSKGF